MDTSLPPEDEQTKSFLHSSHSYTGATRNSPLSTSEPRSHPHESHNLLRSRANKSKERWISRTRLVLRILSFLTSAAIVAVLAHAVSVYYSSKNMYMRDEKYDVELRVWPADLKMKPTLLLLGAASVATLMSAVLCAASISKTVRRITTVSTILTLITSVIAIGLWIAVAVLYKVDDLNENERYDMLSYTCARRHDATLDQAIGDLGSMCYQMRYAWWAALAVGLLEIVAVGVFLYGLVATRRYRSYTQLDGNGEKESDAKLQHPLRILKTGRGPRPS
ncbi:uncharacterized protein Z518_08022 [Rhinocladiella mackenziei CBS 650.93]|uniref:MARVEL domain-containing protein n=1 Tax=Rhinocladiella mackenziei CBS 650.93 TaxID=1442369 RepID=A0A0D2GUZ2_9EURO|nr:uncharacterized protein Z518_08022 [Rhinocladiella mackenziei CBS 650.93]KIX02083.1 hypothetical protein Z518_08022 [Rhinocladiella mackenziei CBS 650.93]